VPNFSEICFVLRHSTANSEYSHGAVRQPLFSVILSRSIHVWWSADFRRCKAAAVKHRATAWQ